MKRRIIATVLAMTMITSVTAMAADEITVNVNGTALELDQPPIIENGRTLVPLRAIAEALGCEVVWNDTDKTASFVQGDVTAIITVGENYILVGDGVYNEEFPIDSPAVIVNSRTMIPLRALSECFGFDVSWNGESKTVEVSSKSMDIDDTVNADEQGKIEVKDNMNGKVGAYAVILQGTVSILEAVDYTSDTLTQVKSELENIVAGADTMSYDELITAFSKLKEIDESLGDMANDAGVSDTVANYNATLEKELNEIMGR